MLKITIPGAELWDEIKHEFRDAQPVDICIEHSLVAISKWESKWHKPFLAKDYKMTREELESYVKCMTITQNVADEAYHRLTSKNLEDIKAYIEDPMTATWFSKNAGGTGGGRRSRETITSELIYYWMIDCGVPMECQKWHINRLLTLIRICNIKAQNGKKMSRKDAASQHALLNEARRKRMGSSG